MAASSSDAGGPSKGNDYAIEALKQVLALASVILALTITFLKDALGEARVDAKWTFLVPIAWALLIVVIWVAIAEAAKNVGAMTTVQYAFANGPLARRLARITQRCFVAAVVVLGIVRYHQPPTLLLSAAPKGRDATGPSSQRPAGFEFVGNIGPFATGKADVLENAGARFRPARRSDPRSQPRE